MYKLLVNAPCGEQRIEKVYESGRYFDDSRVLWDERKDGELGSVTLGKMVRQNGKLIELPDYLPDHAAWIASQDAIIAKDSVKNDRDIAALRDMTNQQIDDWFAANVTTAAQLIKLVRKIVKILIRKELI